MTTEKQRVKELFREWDTLVEPITTPIVYHPGGWEDTVTDELKKEVLRQRLEKLNNGGWNEATDAEVLCYLYTASLVQPLTSDWTQIYLYQTSQWRPELRDTGIDVPKALTEYQKSELRTLKRNIRESQLKRRKNKKKEDAMSNRKLVMEEHEGKVLVGMQQEGCDPIVKTVDGNLDEALPQVPNLLTEAQEQWAKSPKNPAYKPPAVPKKETATAAAAPAGSQKAADLPLLSGTDKPKAEEPAPAESTEAPTETKPEPAAAEEAPAGTEEKVAETTGPAAEQAPEATAPAIQPEPSLEPVEEKATTEPAPQPEQPAAAAAPTGEWEYVLKDGRGPYADVQAAMDAMGMDKDNRPHHNRWDRLSTSLKDQIQRRPKA